MSQAGCYDLRLECDGEGCADHNRELNIYGHSVGQWNLELGSACRAAARKAGWKLLPRGLCLCPRCARRGAKAIQ